EAPRQAIPRPLAGDGGSGRVAATGADGSSARTAASGPVGQSFADRMRAGAGGRAVAELSAPGLTAATPGSEPPPPPPPATTKTDRGFPQLDLLATPAAASEGVGAPSAASRGEANLALLNGEG